MNTGLLKKFATEARTCLRQGVRNRIESLGFDADGNVTREPQEMGGGGVFAGQTYPLSFFNKWTALRKRIAEKGVKAVYEEAAYIWFNRLVAIRILQKNGIIAPVIAYESEATRLPRIVAEARRGVAPDMSHEDRQKLSDLLADPTLTTEQFTLLISAFCKSNPIIAACFGSIADYVELLLPANILAPGGFVDMLNHTEFISDDDFKQTELIGWLYQFYESERKDEVFAGFQKGKKAEVDDIAPATQIFTPNWIVKYMVQNTLGSIYLDNNPWSELKDGMKYLVEPEEPTPDEAKFKYSDLAELTCADLSCGSGHILNEFFDLLYAMYIEEGYSRRSAIEAIFKKNLYGADLDTRAEQLAMFSLLLKACQKDESFADAKCLPFVIDMQGPFDEYTWRDLNGHFNCGYGIFCSDATGKELDVAFKLMRQADNLGSIMKFDVSGETIDYIHLAIAKFEEEPMNVADFEPFIHGLKIVLLLSQKYAAICMNPPYMGSGNMNAALSKYVKDNYEIGKADLFSVFMLLSQEKLLPKAKYGMINMHSWMFLSSFETLRRYLLSNYSIDSMLHLGPRTFDELSGEVVQNTSFVISNHKSQGNLAYYFRLVDFKNSSSKKKHFLWAKEVFPFGIFYHIEQIKYSYIPGVPIGYWVSEEELNILKQKTLVSSVADTRQGFATGNNEKFLRYIWEISKTKRKVKWFPCTKGGNFRKWYGNIDVCVNWENNGYDMKNFKGSVIRNESYYFDRIGSTWSTIANKPSFRLFEQDWLFESKGSVCFPHNEEDNLVLMSYLNSPVVCQFLKLYSPTLDFHEGPIGKVPYKILSETQKEIIVNLTKNCISISKEDWDNRETSWDFKRNALIEFCEVFNNTVFNQFSEVEKGQEIKNKRKRFLSLRESVIEYKFWWDGRYETLRKNEEQLNRLFIEIYGMENDLTPEIPFGEVTILQQGEATIGPESLEWNDDVLMKQLISYFIGVAMGRYRLDKPGLNIAHPKPSEEETAPYAYGDGIVEIDDDGIIPLLPMDSPFADNAVNRVRNLVLATFGRYNEVENLNFLEASLGKSLDAYLVKDFWKDHKKMYQNRPIYWLFSSKKGAFQCLVYMHRMNAYTAERVRIKYLLPYIEFLKSRIDEMTARQADLTAVEARQLANYKKVLDECVEYHDRLHNVAEKQIAFDLDDGVVKNYALFGDVLAKIK